MKLAINRRMALIAREKLDKALSEIKEASEISGASKKVIEDAILREMERQDKKIDGYNKRLNQTA